MKNGDFEASPDNTGADHYQVIPAHSNAIAGWTVPEGICIVYSPPWHIASRNKAIDLTDGCYSLGRVKQIVPTEPGAVYRVRFLVSGHNDGNATKVMYVRAAGASKTFTAACAGKSKDTIDWRPATFDFTAKEERTELEFGDSIKDRFGAFIDNVSMRKIQDAKPAASSAPIPIPVVEPDSH